MSLDAAPQTQEAEDIQGFSRLDLVKHSMKTITKVLKPQDYLSIITFSDRARVRLEPRKMDQGGQAAAATTVDSLSASGGTNIWDAIRVGIDQTKLPICAGKDVVMLLLTDGEPTTNPPKGIVETLKGTLQTIENQNFTISSFGFGYNLDSLLLDSIARLGNGSFGFIPDCSMVGTIFINFLANTLATRLHNARLVVEDTEHNHVFAHTVASNSLTVPIGSIRFGQKRTVLFSRKAVGAGAKPVKSSLEAVSADGKGVDLVAESVESTFSAELNASLLESFVVGHAVDVLYQIAKENYSSKSKIQVAALKEFIAKNVPQDKMSALVKEILLDIESSSANEGQLTKSVSREDWFNKWGRNHLLSFCNAHRYEQCSNFKDKSLQLYGGAQFKKVQDDANTVFVSLPPPVSSIQAEKAQLARFSGGGGAAAGGAAAAAAPKKKVSMSSFMNSRGICFDGAGFVDMADGTTKRVADLRKRDQLKSGARVVALVQTLITDGLPIEVVEMNGVFVTPWHPVRLAGSWVFPAEVGKVEKRDLTAIYNLVLSENHVVEINGLSLITMGHERNEESTVLAHPYFGTKRVVHDLMRFPGWERGLVTLNGATFERDSNNLICAIRDSANDFERSLSESSTMMEGSVSM